MVRDAQETQRRLLAAAVDEFAARGVAGARVDRIAAAAGVNKAMIYAYFGSKEQLFDAVFDALVVSTVEAVPIDAADLAGYAGRLFDETQKHPQALRLAAWFALERGGAARPPAVTASNAAKESAIAEAQRAGLVSTRFPPGELLALVVGLSVLGSAEFAPTGFTDESREERRRTVVEAVGLLSRP